MVDFHTIVNFRGSAKINTCHIDFRLWNAVNNLESTKISSILSYLKAYILIWVLLCFIFLFRHLRRKHICSFYLVVNVHLCLCFIYIFCRHSALTLGSGLNASFNLTLCELIGIFPHYGWYFFHPPRAKIPLGVNLMALIPCEESELARNLLSFIYDLLCLKHDSIMFLYGFQDLGTKNKI